MAGKILNALARDARRAFTDTVIAEYSSGRGTPYIARLMKVSRPVVSKILRDHNIPLRNRSEGMYSRMSIMSTADKGTLVSAARTARFSNLRKATINETFHPAIGEGYHIVANGLKQRFWRIQRQVMHGPYYIDITSHNIAIEIVYKQGFHIRSRAGERLKYLIEAGMCPVYILFDSTETITNLLYQVITLLNLIRKAPTTNGQYWVIRCDRDRGIAHIQDNYWTAIQRPKYRRYVWQWSG
jgi:hypothetical protein